MLNGKIWIESSYQGYVNELITPGTNMAFTMQVHPPVIECSSKSLMLPRPVIRILVAEDEHIHREHLKFILVE